MIRRLGKKKAAALALAGKPWPRSSITASRKARKPGKAAVVRRRRAQKGESRFKRQYHSKERVEFVKSLPCSACHVVGYSENAHLTPVGEKGTGFKGGYRFIAPLCRERPSLLFAWRSAPEGCHFLYDRKRWIFDALFPSFDSVEAARTCELAWQDHLKGESA